MVWDSHCHLDEPVYDRDRGAVLERAAAAGVTGALVPGIGPSTWDRTVACCAAWPGLDLALGIHPLLLADEGPARVEAGLASLRDRLRDSGAVAVGECGLDKPAARGGPDLDDQARVLRRHLEVAAELDLPVVLHCFKAHGRMLDELRAHGPLRGVMHSWSGPAELVPAFVALGLHISFAGALTWPKARRGPASALVVPADRLLVESDGPDQLARAEGPLAAALHAAGRNEPAGAALVAAALEGLRGAPVPDNRASLLGRSGGDAR